MTTKKEKGSKIPIEKNEGDSKNTPPTEAEIIAAQKADEKTAKVKVKKILASSAQFHDFEADKHFTGQYLYDRSAKITDKETGEVETKVIGFVMLDHTTGEEVMVTNADAINKAFTEEYESGKSVKSEKDLVRITFNGKTVIKATGRPYNLFKVELLEVENSEPE